MKLLVLGETGQLGCEIVRQAASARFEPATLDRSDLDLTRLDVIEPVLSDLQFEVLINCAAYTAVDAAESDAQAAFVVNAFAVERIARACSRKGARLVQVSTDYVFDGMLDRPYREDDPPGPINVYGASKLTGERLALLEHLEGTLVVRTSSVFGVGGKNFVETMLRLAGERPRLRVVGDIAMAPTYAADLASGILSLVEADPEPGHYHLTGEGETTWYEFARAVLSQAGLKAAVDCVPAAEYRTAARRPANSVLDTGRARALVPPLPAWQDALSRYLAVREIDAASEDV